LDKKLSIDELLNILDEYNHSELHVHHTSAPSHKDFNGDNYFILQENMRKFHIRERNWKDIGQHLTLFPDGLFVTGRPFEQIPASIKGYNGTVNKVPLAVEMLGNFNVACDAFEGKQKNSILALAKYFYNKGKYIRFHRENASTDCPGETINKDKFMSEVKDFGKAIFSDVNGHWAEQYIIDVVEKGIMVGYSDNTFRPDKAISRAELAMLISTGKLK